MTEQDDYELNGFWHNFSGYSQQMFEQDKDKYTQRLTDDNWVYDRAASAERLSALPGLPPIPPNQRLILETILHLRPSSVFEIGFGSGDNLHNIKVVAPDTRVFGIDVCGDNLSWANRRNPDLAGKLLVWDAAWPHSTKLSIYNMCFSNTVLMHINDTHGYLTALANMFYFGTDYVLIMENWETHAYMDDIMGLLARGMIPWKSAHFYYRHSPEFDRPHLMVVSRSKIDRPAFYVPLYDYYGQLWANMINAPDAKIGKLPGQGAVRPKPAFG